MDLKEMRWKATDSPCLAEDRDQWWAAMNTGEEFFD
jgi:hypothetical protein